MRPALFTLALLLLIHDARASGPQPIFPLIGHWRIVERMEKDGHFHKLNYLYEYEFRPPGRWDMLLSPTLRREDAGSGNGWYTFQPPDRCEIVENYGDSRGPTLRVQFHVDGKSAILKIVTITKKPPATFTVVLKLIRLPSKPHLDGD